jgi:hypothetical protein
MKKKFIFLVVFSGLFIIPVCSQNNYRHQIISIGIGPCFTGLVDEVGTAMYNGYLLSLNNRISINSRLSFFLINDTYITNLQATKPEAYNHLSGMGLDAGFNFSPFKTGKRFIYLMAGGSLRYAATTYAGSNTGTDQSTESSWYNTDFTTFNTRRYFSPGYYLGLGFTENISKHITYGLNCNFGMFKDFDVLCLIGINIGYDFH